TVYTNAFGEMMLSVYQDAATGLRWETFNKYDTQGRLVLHAEPSAVTGYDETKPDLLNGIGGPYQYLNNNNRLLTNLASHSTTPPGDSTAGGVTGYIQQISLQQGQNGPAVLQKTWQYFLHTANGLSVSPVASDSVYRNIDGTGEEKTTYGYSWFTIPGT